MAAGSTPTDPARAAKPATPTPTAPVAAAPADAMSAMDPMVPGAATGMETAGAEPAAPIDPLESPAPIASMLPPEPEESEPAHARAAPVALPKLGEAAAAEASKHFGLLLDVGVEIAAVVGSRELKLEQVLAIQPGSIIDLDKYAGEPIELYVNGKPIALAEIVVVDGRLGARVVETLAAPPVES
jgi:flagellar motor switch protein FliN/FliY